MEDITSILYGLIIFVVCASSFIFAKYVKPWISAKINAEQWNTVVNWAETLVALAEKTIYGEHGLGSMRFEKVLGQLQELCNKYGYSFDEEMLKSAVQYAWQMVIGTSDKGEDELYEYRPEISG